MPPTIGGPPPFNALKKMVDWFPPESISTLYGLENQLSHREAL